MSYFMLVIVFFFFKQKTAYEMRISDWSSDVCSSDLWGPQGSSAAGGSDDHLQRTLARRGGGHRFPDPRGVPRRGGRPLRRRRGGRVRRSAARRCQIRIASGRERCCQYVSVSLVDVTLKKKIKINILETHQNTT